MSHSLILPKAQKLRIDRLLSQRGLGMRREIHQKIRHEDVYVFENGERRLVEKADEYFLDNQSFDIRHYPSETFERNDAPPLLIAYHKPINMLCTEEDPWGRKGLDHVLPEHWRKLFHPVGRLDADTSGLLLFSSLGILTQYLMHPKRQIPRAYWANVENIPADLKEKIEAGVETSLGVFSGQIKEIDLEQKRVLIEVEEGKYRMVRRMLHNAGASVTALHRMRFGQVELNDLLVDQFRVVSAEELALLGISA